MCDTHSSSVFMHPVALGAGGSSGVCFRSAACTSWGQASETKTTIKPWFYNTCYYTINTTGLSHPFCGQNHQVGVLTYIQYIY